MCKKNLGPKCPVCPTSDSVTSYLPLARQNLDTVCLLWNRVCELVYYCCTILCSRFRSILLYNSCSSSRRLKGNMHLNSILALRSLFFVYETSHSMYGERDGRISTVLRFSGVLSFRQAVVRDQGPHSTSYLPASPCESNLGISSAI